MLSFQRLHVYQRSIQLAALVIEIVDAVPRGNGERCDQLVRASESIIRNIAEGAGRWSPADMARHYKIARGEAMECVGCLDLLRLRHLVSEAHYERAPENDRGHRFDADEDGVIRSAPRSTRYDQVHAYAYVKVHDSEARCSGLSCRRRPSPRCPPAAP